ASSSTPRTLPSAASWWTAPRRHRPPISGKPLRLVGAERGERVGGGGAASGDERGGQGDEDEEGEGGGEGCGVEGMNAEQERFQQFCGGRGEGEADEHSHSQEAAGRGKHQACNLGGFGAEGDANAELARASGDEQAHQAVKAHGGEQQGEAGKEGEEAGIEL